MVCICIKFTKSFQRHIDTILRLKKHRNNNISALIERGFVKSTHTVDIVTISLMYLILEIQAGKPHYYYISTICTVRGPHPYMGKHKWKTSIKIKAN